MKAGVEVERVDVRVWAHAEGEPLWVLEDRLRVRGYKILKRGVCPENGKPGVLIADTKTT